jgi:hypothetical protein
VAQFFFEIIKKCKENILLLNKKTILSLIKYAFLGINNQMQMVKNIVFSEMILLIKTVSDREVIKNFVADLFGDYLDIVQKSQICIYNNYYIYLSRVIKLIGED